MSLRESLENMGGGEIHRLPSRVPREDGRRGDTQTPFASPWRTWEEGRYTDSLRESLEKMGGGEVHRDSLRESLEKMGGGEVHRETPFASP